MTALVTALLSNTIVSPGRAKVAAIHTPYILPCMLFVARACEI